MHHTFSLRQALLMFLLCLASSSFAQITDPVRTQNGLISGVQNGNIRVFKGIPFAAPPVGDLRWKAPQPATNWSGVRACDKFSASAIQNPPNPFWVWSKEFMAPLEPLSEDCLYLNVWTPATIKEPMPVIVWIHGGAFTGGSGSCPIYDGEGMARKDVVFVTINYRLGVFGFLAHPELTQESGTNSSGNYAFLDMIAALQWVQNNIAAFGGDPKRVTIAGQSAGGNSVRALVASPKAKGLFQRAIAQSGNKSEATLYEASIKGLALMKKLGDTSLAAMRLRPAAEVLKAYSGVDVTPVIDGYVLPKDIYRIFSEGAQNDVAFLSGWNNDEGMVWDTLTAAALRERLAAPQQFGALAPKALKIYPAKNNAEALQAQRNLFRDMAFAWPSYLFTKAHSTNGKGNTWLYRFDRVPPGKPELGNVGAFHSAEIAYALNTLDTWNRPWQSPDRQLSEQMSNYWVNFARNGNPNGTGLPEWTPYEPAKHNVLVFAKKTKMQNGPLRAQFDLLDERLAAMTPDMSLYQKALFIDGADTLPYRILYPENYDRSKKYPLVIFLHGAGERGSDNDAQLVHGASLFLKSENRANFPCIVVAPQCPKSSFWGSATFDRSSVPTGMFFNYQNEITPALRLAMELTKRVIASEAVDAERVYITGLSMGGMGTFEAVGRFPTIFAAAAPICGGGDASFYNDRTAKIPFRIFHGAVDLVVPVVHSRNMYAGLQALHGNVSYIEYPGVNHNSWDYAFAEPDFVSWFFSKKRMVK